ncbi:3'(2'),5'-bisphosphate nucleotidase CysQ [Balneatrix alpica]|uniref:3'(2'),5'-bisphosphate nucleotidase CysQ n=1 Tax=Balneatrix alpica TaxID=75684 RepID=A0ABV5ZF60_9GAMM|nr:3'(2'),5'-bisphosphate nucleotidase CysQ [Balneatrix alpica]
MELLELLPHLTSISRDAGKAILDIYQQPHIQAQHKADTSPVTAADLAAHQLIEANLHRLTPDIPLISEESPQPPLAVRSQWPAYWLVDPLDGTKEFLKRNDEFTVNIALIQHNRPVLGIVHVPVSGSTYVGVPGQCAYKLTRQGKQELLQTNRVLGYRPVTLLTSRSHQDPQAQALAERLEERLAPVTLLPMGSSLKFCLLAEGLGDIYMRPQPTSEWDTAAAQAVLEAAGGRVWNQDWQPLGYNQRESLVNPGFLAVGDAQQNWQGLLEGMF